MADGENKKKNGFKRSPIEPLILLLIGSLVVGQIVENLQGYFAGGWRNLSFVVWLSDLTSWLIPALEVLAVFAVAFFFGSILYVNGKTAAIRKKEAKELYPEGEEPSLFDLPGITETLPDFEENPRWRKVVEMAGSENENDRRQAIIEADIMLGEMLEHMGYRGESVGERLQQIDKSKFQTLDQAWKAHKVRNAIAHEGEVYRVEKRKVLEVIDLFRQVFQEFHYI